jgi:hypothetical protein
VFDVGRPAGEARTAREHHRARGSGLAKTVFDARRRAVTRFYSGAPWRAFQVKPSASLTPGPSRRRGSLSRRAAPPAGLRRAAPDAPANPAPAPSAPAPGRAARDPPRSRRRERKPWRHPRAPVGAGLGSRRPRVRPRH